jgi:hypothetical protein
MISKTELSLTQADMRTAIAHWLNATTFKSPVQVERVEAEKSSGYNATEHFKVTLVREEASDATSGKAIG